LRELVLGLEELRAERAELLVHEWVLGDLYIIYEIYLQIARTISTAAGKK